MKVCGHGLIVMEHDVTGPETKYRNFCKIPQPGTIIKPMNPMV
jgi:hypothetical protein